MGNFVCEEKHFKKRSRDKSLIELPKERAKRGRPRNNFISYKTTWCLAYKTFCDRARKEGLCSEESPVHKMPFPFYDFDCEKYIKVPLVIVNKYSEQELIVVIDRALIKLNKQLGAVANLRIEIDDVVIDEGNFVVSFNIISFFKDNKRERYVEVMGRC